MFRHPQLETKYARSDAPLTLQGETRIEGYASRFGEVDQGGDLVMPGAYQASLSALSASGRKVKMLWQHDPAQPIGVWDEVREDATGLWVSGRLLRETQRGAEAIALISAGALDGLSIGYRTRRSRKTDSGQRQLMTVELWEVSLVTFPMLATARLDDMRGKSQTPETASQILARSLRAATAALAAGQPQETK